MAKRIVLMGILAALTACSGGNCDEVLVLESNPTNGAILYRNNCRTCHGNNGEGTDRGPDLGPRLAFLDRCGLVEQIRDGSGDMPSFDDTLALEDIADITDYVFIELR